MNGFAIIKSDLSADYVRSVIDYDPMTGKMRGRIAFKKIPRGSLLGNQDRYGYLRVSIKHKYYAAHRLAWLIHYGEWPNGIIDHINRIRSDNRIANLRVVDFSINSQNRGKRGRTSSRFMGVTWNKRVGKWQATIKRAGVNKYLGLFDREEDAGLAYEQARGKAA